MHGMGAAALIKSGFTVFYLCGKRVRRRARGYHAHVRIVKSETGIHSFTFERQPPFVRNGAALAALKTGSAYYA